MSRRWCFFDPATGQFAGRMYSGPAEALELNTPPGLAPLEGDFDPLSQRVDLDSGEVVDWRPPQPDADHEWDSAARRWVKTAVATARDSRRFMARSKIDRAERRQLRALRELALGDQTARARLQAIEDEIVAARADLQ